MFMKKSIDHKEKYEEKKEELKSHHASFQQYVDEQNGGFDVE